MGNFKENSTSDWAEDSIRLILTPSSVAKATFFYVQEVGYFKAKAKYYTERQNLNSYLIVFTVSGKGHLKYRDKFYVILPNQAFIIDCMEYQYYNADSVEPWEFLWIHFNGSTSGGYYEQFFKGESPIISLVENSVVPSIIHQIIKIHQHKDIRTEPMSSKFIVDLLTELIISSNSVDNSVDNTGYFIPDYIKMTMKDIEKRFNEKITLDQLAHKFAVSKFYLAKEFKKYTGFSPNEYIINTRINYAKELLKYSEASINDIASRIGIENVSHFINLFKDREDTTPLAYRKEWK